MVAGIRHSNGIAADLGGGSLELVEVSNTEIGKLQSLELGTKVISSKNISNQQTITEIIKNVWFGALGFVKQVFLQRWPKHKSSAWSENERVSKY